MGYVLRLTNSNLFPLLLATGSLLRDDEVAANSRVSTVEYILQPDLTKFTPSSEYKVRLDPGTSIIRKAVV